MPGALSTISVLDKDGSAKSMRVWDESGAGTGPFSFVSTIERTPTLSRVTSSGTVAAGSRKVSFANVHASANATVLGATLKPYEVVTYEADGNDTISSIAYDATGSELLIARLV